MSVTQPLSLLEKRYTKSTGKPTRHKFAGSEVYREEYVKAIEAKALKLEGDNFIAKKCAEECLEMLDTDLTKGATNGQIQSQKANRQNQAQKVNHHPLAGTPEG